MIVNHTISLAVFVVRMECMGKQKLNYPNAKTLAVKGEILLFCLSSRDEGYVWLLLNFCI